VDKIVQKKVFENAQTFFNFFKFFISDIYFFLLISHKMDLPFELKSLKRGRPKDDVWQYYLEGERDSQGHASAVCTYCNIKYSRGETSLLKGHLANHCMKAPGNVIRMYQRNFEENAKKK
jgi:hypothetical protein